LQDNIAKCTLNGLHRNGEYLIHLADDGSEEHQKATSCLGRSSPGAVWGTLRKDGKISPTHLEFGGKVYTLCELEVEQKSFSNRVRSAHQKATKFLHKYLLDWLKKYPEDQG
jgi:hypothetical protein